MCRRILQNRHLGSSLSVVNFVMMPLLFFVVAVGCATRSASDRSVDYKRRSSALARELKKKRAVIEELKEKNLVLSAQAKRNDAVHVQSPQIVADHSETESVWTIPPGAFRENLERQKRGFPIPLAPTAGLVTEDATDRTLASENIPRSLPSKRVETTRVSEPTDESANARPPAPPVIDLTGGRRQTSRSEVNGWIVPQGAIPPMVPQESAAPIGSHAAKAAALTPEIASPRNDTNSSIPVPDHAAAKAAAESAAPVSSEKGEHILYAKVLQSFRKKSRDEMSRATQLFLKTYPESTHADNALYLASILALEEKDHEAAARGFDRILKDYPHGNKAVSALFAKGILYREKRDYSKSRETFHRVQKVFPGSPESQRVSLEMRLLSKLERTRP